MFVSANTNKNLDVLYQYSLHRLYQHPNLFKAEVLARDNLFVPSGFDSLNLINELCKGSEDRDFEDTILAPQASSRTGKLASA